MSFPLGVYGDVHRVKIMFNKKENALVQMADASQAQLGTMVNSSNESLLLLYVNLPIK